ncbi:MAG: hypothetical protein KJN90_05450 [Gammaproteobacteria bacterium]|nr:hypothetical protein [Gammaproteobacteria bacterium]
MKFLKIVLQTAGLLRLIPSVAIAMLAIAKRSNDGSSIIIQGGESISGKL